MRFIKVFGISALLILLFSSAGEANSSNFLFFEISLIDNMTDGCPPRPYYDFPTYYFNKTDRHLYRNVAPEWSYDFIEFNNSLIAIAGVGKYGHGISSQLEPIYGLPYPSIGKTSEVPNYWVQTEEMGKIQIMNITESGLLVVYFDNQSIELASGSNWSKLGQCSELRIENHGYLDKKTNEKTLKFKEHPENFKTISGFIVDTNGKSIKNARVYIVYDSYTTTPIFTDENGFYSFIGFDLKSNYSYRVIIDYNNISKYSPPINMTKEIMVYQFNVSFEDSISPKETQTPFDSKPSTTPGFEVIFIILGLLTVSYVLKNYEK